MSTEDVLEDIVAAVGADIIEEAIQAIADAIRGGHVDPLRARQLIEDEMTLQANEAMKRELGR